MEKYQFQPEDRFLVAGHGHTQGMTKMAPGLAQLSLQGSIQTRRSSRHLPR